MLKKRRLRRESRQGDFSLEKPRDGHDGLVGSIDEVLSKVHALETAVKCQPELRSAPVEEVASLYSRVMKFLRQTSNQAAENVDIN
jgi:hypothetical protein